MLQTTPRAALAVPSTPHVSAPELLRVGLDAALGACDLIVGSGAPPPQDGSETMWQNLRRHGALGYTGAFTTAAVATWFTAAATTSEMFAPARILASPVQFTVALTDPAEWLSAAQLGATTWGTWFSRPVQVVSDVCLGAARGQVQILRRLVDLAVDRSGDLAAQAETNRANRQSTEPGDAVGSGGAMGGAAQRSAVLPCWEVPPQPVQPAPVAMACVSPG